MLTVNKEKEFVGFHIQQSHPRHSSQKGIQIETVYKQRIGVKG